jgi:glycosyltransferase involved in cell wall biosynthesis
MFSHRLSMFRELPRSNRSNIFAKEYLIALHRRVLGSHGLARMVPLYDGIWRLLSPCFFRPAQVNLFLMHGNCAALMHKARAAGGIVVGEAVNAHPAYLHRLLQQEARAIGLKRRIRDASISELREIDLIDYLLCPSTAVRDSYVAMGFDRARTLVIPYGCDMGVQEARATNVSRRKKLVCVAQVIMRKGIHHLLDCLATYIATQPLSFELTLIGSADADYLSYLRGRTFAFNHIEHMSNAQLKQQLREFDVFVLPSIEDGFAIAVTEALEKGVPVVVSKFAGASEIVSNCGGGLVVDPTDHPAMLQAIIDCAQGRYPPLTGKIRSWQEYADELVATLTVLPPLPA